MYISEIIDNKLRKLSGKYSFKDLLKILSIDLVSYSVDDSENFLRQSIYRLKREGIIFKENGLFLFNSNKIWEPVKKIPLSKLQEKGLVASGKRSLLYKYGIIEQIPAKEYVIVQKRHGLIKNDTGALVGYTKMQFEKNEKILFELAKIFEMTSSSAMDLSEIYRVLNRNTDDIKNTLIKLKKFISKRQISKYDLFIDWFSKRIRRFHE